MLLTKMEYLDKETGIKIREIDLDTKKDIEHLINFNKALFSDLHKYNPQAKIDPIYKHLDFLIYLHIGQWMRLIFEFTQTQGFIFIKDGKEIGIGYVDSEYDFTSSIAGSAPRIKGKSFLGLGFKYNELYPVISATEFGEPTELTKDLYQALGKMMKLRGYSTIYCKILPYFPNNKFIPKKQFFCHHPSAAKEPREKAIIELWELEV